MNKELTHEEKVILKEFIQVKIPEYIKKYNQEIDFEYCYEEMFVFSQDLLRGHKIDPSHSPWGDGKSIIFNNIYLSSLNNVMQGNEDEMVREYCKICLEVLQILNNHLVQ